RSRRCPPRRLGRRCRLDFQALGRAQTKGCRMSTVQNYAKEADITSVTERVIRDQFLYLREALDVPMPRIEGGTLVFVGCGTSFYLARTLASVANSLGHSAIAVPGAEWTSYPRTHLASDAEAVIIGLSRSGTTSET